MTRPSSPVAKPVAPVEPVTPTRGALICPNCGRALVAYVGQPAEAPWICTHDALGWFEAELTPAGRVLWDAPARSFRRSPELRSAREAELGVARANGTNVSVSRFGVLSAAQLAIIHGRAGVSAAVVAAAAAASARFTRAPGGAA